MRDLHSAEELVLGEINGRTVRLGTQALHLSIAHARELAAELGTRDLYSSLAAYWTLETRLRLWQQVFERIGAKRAATYDFLEIGSGMGLFTLVGRLLGLKVTGLEASSDRYQASMQIARALFANNGLMPPLIQAASEGLPLPDASMDFIASFQTIEHVSDLPRTLVEFRRVLRPGGVFFAQAPNYRSFYEAHYGVFVPLATGKPWTRRFLQRIGRPTPFLEHLGWIEPETLREMMNRAGFSSVTVGRVSTPQLPKENRSIRVHPLPFRFRRGVIARRAAHGLAVVAARLHLSNDLYPQLEIWASA